ncbi:CDF family Co(II)/Ni(II) efflux transporter DmeF [Litorimonas sp.]|uniref:CDF family Co(II)/Ni(II) efflux transporter DmeF n=1 Tax=Litorimonas sp. TaxID=1892381 RepID=UPI003A8C389F
MTVQIPASPSDGLRDDGTHDHVYLGDNHDRNAKRTWFVIALTASMMVVEIVAGTIFGSMALVADGWHMCTHAAALMITAMAYYLAKRHAKNPRFSFGTGKLGDLAGFASAVVLALIAFLIGWESLVRLANPVQISFPQAIFVAVIGLIINLVSAWLLKEDHSHHHGHGHSHHIKREHVHEHDHHDHAHHGQDQNLRAAYLHVLADALTSVLAIVALTAGSVYGWIWLDPLMGIVGALVIARWSWGLIRDTAATLLNYRDETDHFETRVRKAIDEADNQITDLHLWELGPGHQGLILSLKAKNPQPPSFYKDKLSHIRGLSHITVEIELAK